MSRPGCCVTIDVQHRTFVLSSIAQKICINLGPDTPYNVNRACSVPREARGRREWASARQGSTARPGYASPVLWERTVHAKVTGIQCRAPLGNSAPWWGKWRAPIAQGGTFAPGLAGSTPRHVQRGWCAAETFSPLLASGVLLVRGQCGRTALVWDIIRLLPEVVRNGPGIAETSANWVAFRVLRAFQQRSISPSMCC